MFIKLNEIPEEGQTFELSERDYEIAQALKDVTEDEPFAIDCRILPSGQAYDLKGHIKTTLNHICSFCAGDYPQKVEQNFHEFLMVADRSKVSFNVTGEDLDAEEEVHATYLDSHVFDLGNMIREVLVLTTPTQPKCKEDCKGLCTTCGHDLNLGLCECSPSKKMGHLAFSVLKSVKLK